MSFWGVEVLPGKPFIQRFSKSRRKLHISQATLSSNVATGYTIHCQCNVREKNPILLCSLNTTYQRSSHIDVEFGEDDGDILLSVTGNGSNDYGVHLTGYYISDASINGHGVIGKIKSEEENVAEDNAAKNSSGESQSREGNNKVEKMKRFNFGFILKMILLIFLVLFILGRIISTFESYEVQPKVCTCWM
ncbi:hypothetical protein C5167_048715 [Papaver somniferum]|uniref:Nucleoplasmin-like domain-containing protein n=1 Tax=Papaver somniferum TaxID=3469 RepID=A0A4Y7KIQ9_PAPSO|nr:peptidyl-prolyl cis-trans isomerase FKBP43-like [Papaver somniferum]RZC73234.1 hypothetical protein C5167_048715 [Papaver somniferum]